MNQQIVGILRDRRFKLCPKGILEQDAGAQIIGIHPAKLFRRCRESRSSFGNKRLLAAQVERAERRIAQTHGRQQQRCDGAKNTFSHRLLH